LCTSFPTVTSKLSVFVHFHAQFMVLFISLRYSS
jgi:hypothetical protein